MLHYLLLFYLAHFAVCDELLKRPNFVVIITDDQDVALGGMNPMKNVQRFIANEGVTFTNSYVTSPICCPSRASILTGMYVHNHMTHNNSLAGGCYGSTWREHEQRTFATVLNTAGYKTFYAGKYLNQYGVKETGGPEQVPPGWTEWHGLVGNSVYYNYTMSNNGVPTFSTDEYLTDVIRELGINYIENQTETRPFLMVLAPPAPHQPFTPAARHRGTFSNMTVVRNPNFNIFAEDKHWLMRMPPSPLPEASVQELDKVYGTRWEALLAVDEMVADVINALETSTLLDNTYIIYTSDNGFHMGQFSQFFDKRQPYETDTKVPLIMKGPGINKNVENHQPVMNIDLAPTIISLAGLDVPEQMDGKPIDLQNAQIIERNMLIEYYGESRDGTVDENCPWKYDSDHLAQCRLAYDCKCQDAKNNTFACLRHIGERINKKYCIFADDEDFIEMYDLTNDPYEMKNIINEVFPAIRHWYRLKLIQMLGCKGARNCENPSEESATYFRVEIV